MEDNQENHKKGPNLHIQLPQTNTQDTTETICNTEHWQRTKQGPIEIEIKRRQWVVLGTHSGNRHPSLPDMPLHGIHRKRGREEGRIIPGGSTS